MDREYLDYDIAPRIFLAPDDGGGTGGAAVDDPPKSVSMSQDEFDKLVEGRLARQKKEIERKNAAKEKALQDRLDALQAEIDASKNAPPAADDVKGQLELQETRHKKAIGDLQTRLEDAEKRSAEEREKRLTGERDKIIYDALHAVKCHDTVAGYRYVKEQVFYDVDEGTWKYRTKKGGTVEVIDGVQEELPNYLRAPQMQGGGSGSQGGVPKVVAQQKQLDAEVKLLNDLQAKGASSGSTADLMAYQRQKAKVQELKKKLESS